MSDKEEIRRENLRERYDMFVEDLRKIKRYEEFLKKQKMKISDEDIKSIMSLKNELMRRKNLIEELHRNQRGISSSVSELEKGSSGPPNGSDQGSKFETEKNRGPKIETEGGRSVPNFETKPPFSVSKIETKKGTSVPKIETEQDTSVLKIETEKSKSPKIETKKGTSVPKIETEQDTSVLKIETEKIGSVSKFKTKTPLSVSKFKTLESLVSKFEPLEIWGEELSDQTIVKMIEYIHSQNFHLVTKYFFVHLLVTCKNSIIKLTKNVVDKMGISKSSFFTTISNDVREDKLISIKRIKQGKNRFTVIDFSLLKEILEKNVDKKSLGSKFETHIYSSSSSNNINSTTTTTSIKGVIEENRKKITVTFMLMNFFGLQKKHLNRPILDHIVNFILKEEFLVPILSVRYTFLKSPQNVSNYLLKTFEEEYWYFISFEEKEFIQEIFDTFVEIEGKNLEDLSTDDLKRLSHLLGIVIYDKMKREKIMEKVKEKIKEMKDFSEHMFSLLHDFV